MGGFRTACCYTLARSSGSRILLVFDQDGGDRVSWLPVQYLSVQSPSTDLPNPAPSHSGYS